MPGPADRPPASLRERKKARTRHAIQRCALALFERQGYDATTVEQIIEEAEVSESTFYRYFPTKASVVLDDDYDPLLVEAFRAQPPELSTLQALRAGFRAVFDEMSAQEMAEQHARIALSLSVPDLRASMLDQFAQAMRMLAEVVGERSGLGADHPQVRTLAGAVVGAAIAAMFTLGGDPDVDLVSAMDETFATLEAGFSL